MSPQLTDYYRVLKAWIEGGYPEIGKPALFKRDLSLCGNLINFLIREGYDLESVNYYCQEQRRLFQEAGLHRFYPFNPTLAEYRYEIRHLSLYSNHKRLKWIHDHAGS